MAPAASSTNQALDNCNSVAATHDARIAKSLEAVNIEKESARRKMRIVLNFTIQDPSQRALSSMSIFWCDTIS